MAGKIRFRELSIEDVDDLYSIYSDKEAMKYRGSKPMESIEDAKKYVENIEVLKEQTLTLRKGVELIKTQELIGSVMYRFDLNRKTECEIGYSIGHKFWGLGLGKEIVENSLKKLVEKKTIKDVLAWSNKENLASIKILEKNGFICIEQEENQNSYLYRRKIG